MGPDDLQRLQPREGRPPVIGVHRRLPEGALKLSFSGGGVKSTAEGAWQSTAAGRLWRLEVTSPSARAMRIHFRDFAIGAGSLWLHSASGQVVGPYSGSGLYGDGDFWSGIVFGDSLTIEYLPNGESAGEAVPFQIVAISHIWDDALGGGGEADVQPPIAASGEARTGREALNPLTDRINVVVGRQLKKSRLTKATKQIQSVERSASLDHPLPKAATPLSPGQSITFSVGPVDSPTLFVGDNSFQLEVPDNASRVTFTLKSDADVELLVRYGEDNELENGRPVSDYRADEFLAGTEEIVITPQSDPPLQAGTYFVSVVVWATGVEVNCTLTATVERDDTPLPPISGGTLTPGQPADFRLGPVDSPTLFQGDVSYQLEVPEDATRVTFTLESDADVALYVRFGEDNTVQDGRAVFDHGSRNPEGNERIGITRRSDPPLRAGTYFVSVALFDTGVVAMATLTAEVETDTMDCHLDVTCYPEWSSSTTGVARIVFETGAGSSSYCSGTLLNNRRQDLTPYFLTAAHCVATEEEARSVIAFWRYQTQTCNGELPDIQSVPRTEGARLLSTLGGGTVADPVGDMTLLRLEGDLPDGVMFQGWDVNPQPVGTQVTGIHHPGSDDWGFFKRISFGQIIPDPASRISDDVYAFTSYTQGYTEGGSSGSALFSSPGTVVGALSFGRGNDAEAENACRIGSARHDGYTHFSVFYPHIRQFIDEEFALDFAHFANGASITSDLVLVNVAPDPIRPILYFYDRGGNRIAAESVVEIAGELEVTEDGALSVQREMEPFEELTISTHGQGEVVGGSVKVVSDGPIGGVLRFDIPGIGVAGVGAGQPVRDAIFPARRQAGGIRTAAAIRNLEEEELVVSCYLMKEGAVLEEKDITLEGNGQDGRFIEEVFTATDTSDFVGSVRCTAEGEFTGVAVELDAGKGIFTTLPVVPVNETRGGNKETTLDFAHFANGASITSDLVLVNVAPDPIRPALYFYDRGGNRIAAESVVEIAGELEVTEDGALSVQREMEPFEELTISTHGQGEVVGGSVKVVSDGPIGGVLRFDIPGIGVAGVGAGQPVRDAIFPARRQAGGIRTAAAIRNLEEEELVVSCYLMKEGAVLEEKDITLEGNGQDGRFIEEVFTATDTSEFVGSVRCTAEGEFTGVAVELDAGNGIFTTLPVIRVADRDEEDPIAAPPTVSLSVSPTSIARGESATLSWSSTNAVSAEIAPAIGTVPTSGSRSVSPTSTTTYRITVRDGDGRTASETATVTVAEPPSLAPADQAAFNDVFVGKRVLADLPNYYLDFVRPGRFEETEGSAVYPGSYTYRNTGSNTGTVTLNYDDGDRCTFQLTFTSGTSGTATFSCNDGTSGSTSWRLVDIPSDDDEEDTNRVCVTGSTIESGSECALQYPQGTPDAGVKFGRFAVGVQFGSEKGCVYIGSGTVQCGNSSSSVSGTLNAPSGNRYPLDFAASKIEGSSSWRISKLSVTLQE